MKGFDLGGILKVIMTMGIGIIWLVKFGKGEKLHKVGNSQGWNQNVNYTLWSNSQQFYVHDWLYFGFDKRYYNVLEVNKTSYENCNDRDFIKNITKGGRDVFQLTEARPYFFLTGGGYCFHGMKVSVNVSEAPPFSPAPSPSSSSSSSSRNGSLSNKTCWILNTLLLYVAFLFS